MYKTLYERGENGRSPIEDREFFDSQVLKPFDKKEFGFNPVLEAVASEIIKIDTARRPLRYLRQRLSLAPDSAAESYRGR